MPSQTVLIEDVPKITFAKGMFRAKFSGGLTLAFRPHEFMVAVRASQAAIEQWFAQGQPDVAEFKRARGEH